MALFDQPRRRSTLVGKRCRIMLQSLTEIWRTNAEVTSWLATPAVISTSALHTYDNQNYEQRGRQMTRGLGTLYPWTGRQWPTSGISILPIPEPISCDAHLSGARVSTPFLASFSCP